MHGGMKHNNRYKKPSQKKFSSMSNNSVFSFKSGMSAMDMRSHKHSFVKSQKRNPPKNEPMRKRPTPPKQVVMDEMNGESRWC